MKLGRLCIFAARSERDGDSKFVWRSRCDQGAVGRQGVSIADQARIGLVHLPSRWSWCWRKQVLRFAQDDKLKLRLTSLN